MGDQSAVCPGGRGPLTWFACTAFSWGADNVFNQSAAAVHAASSGANIIVTGLELPGGWATDWTIEGRENIRKWLHQTRFSQSGGESRYTFSQPVQRWAVKQEPTSGAPAFRRLAQNTFRGLPSRQDKPLDSPRRPVRCERTPSRHSGTETRSALSRPFR